MSQNETRVEALRNYLMQIINELNENFEQLNINFLSDDVDNYSIDKIPEASTIDTWINGIKLYRDVYSFRSRMNYSADVITNIENIGFYEKFENIIAQKNKNKELPIIENIETIRCLNCGTMNNATTNTAEFDIQLQIEYRN